MWLNDLALNSSSGKLCLIACVEYSVYSGFFIYQKLIRVLKDIGDGDNGKCQFYFFLKS